MAGVLVLHAKVRQGLPLRLPPQPAPRGVSAADLESRLFDLDGARRAYAEVIGPAQRRAVEALGELVEAGAALSLAVSVGGLDLMRRWVPGLSDPLLGLLRQPGLEVVCGEPHEALVFAFDISRFGRHMSWARARLERIAGRPIKAAEVSGYCLNHEIYHALARLGFGVVLASSERHAADGRHLGRPTRWGEGPVALYRMTWLSEELGWALRGGEVAPQRMAETVAGAPGEVALVTFELDDVAFSRRGPAGAAGLLRALAEECTGRGVELLTVPEAAARGRVVEAAPPLWTVGEGLPVEQGWRDGWWEGLIFGRMQQAYAMARLAGQARLTRLADWLLQRDNLTPRGWAGVTSVLPGGAVRLRGHDETAAEVVAVYDNFVRAATWCARGGGAI